MSQEVQLAVQRLQEDDKRKGLFETWSHTHEYLILMLPPEAARKCVAQMEAQHGEAFQHAKGEGVMDGGEASQCVSSAIAREWYDGLINVAWRETFSLILASLKVRFPSVLIQRMEPLRRWAGRKPVASRSRAGREQVQAAGFWHPKQ